MAVLAEGISVIVRFDAIARLMEDDWAKFAVIVPNQTLCCDNELARVGLNSERGIGASRQLTTDPTHQILKDAILGDLDRVILPRLSHWQHPRFFGYFTGRICSRAHTRRSCAPWQGPARRADRAGD